MARASVSKRADVRPDGKPWLVRWREANGRQRKASFKRKVDADRYAAELDGQFSRGEYVDPSAGNQLVRTYGEAWLERQGHLKPKAASSQRSLWRSQVEPRWGDVALADVRYSDVKAWVAKMGRAEPGKRALSASRRRQSYHVLTGLLDEAVKDRLLARNPAAGVPLPKIKPSDRRYLAHAQVDALAAAARGPAQVPHPDREALVYLLAYGGPRWGEAAALRVMDVNVLRKRVTVVKAISDVDGVLVEEDAKDHERREIPIPAFLMKKLGDLIAGRDRKAPVFPNSRGTWLRNQNVRRDWWDDAAKAADLAGLTPHDLRHTAASLAVAAGANVLAVARMLGHADPSVTLRVYADLFDDDLDAVAARLDESRADSRAPQKRPKGELKVTEIGAASP